MKLKTTLLALTLALFPAISSAMSQAEEERILKQAMKMHEQGNITRAIQLYRQVSTHPAAQNNLGSIYFEQGKYKEALVWLRKATTPPHRVTYANNMLGIMYFEGNGVKQNFAKAKQHFSEACKYKLQDGCNNLQVVNNRLNEQKNTVTTKKSQSSIKEQRKIALQHFTQGNFEQAIKIYQELANKGDAISQSSLGTAYYIMGNLATSKMWFTKACNNGDKDACKELSTRF